MNNKSLRSFISVIVFSIQFPVLCYSQTAQKGRVLEKDSHGTPIENTHIVVKDAAPASSGTDGKYKLVFKSKTPGEMIFADSISKNGYELVNEPQIKDWILSDIKDFNIILCKKGSLKESREHFYHVGKFHYEAEFKRRSSEIEAFKLTNQISEKEYNKKQKEIFDEKQESIERLNYYSDLFSRINTDELSEVEQKAYQFSKVGRIDEAIQVYEHEKLIEKFFENDSLRKEVNEDLKSMIPSVRRYAELCAFAGGQNNYEKAGKCYEAIAMSDTTNYEFLRTTAHFFNKQNQYEKAYFYYLKAINYCPNSYQHALIYNNLSSIEIKLKKYQKAKNNLLKSIDLFEVLHKDGTEIELGIAESLSNLSLLQFELKEYSEAIIILNKVTKIYEKYVKEYPELWGFKLAETQNNLAYYQNQIHDLSNSKINFNKSISFYRNSAKEHPNTYNDELAGSLDNYAGLLLNINEYDSAYIYEKESLKIYNTLANFNPYRYKPHVARVQSNIAFVLFRMAILSEGNNKNNLCNESMKYFNDALDLYSNELLIVSPLVYKHDLATIWGNMALLECVMADYNSSENHWNNALKLYDEIEVENPVIYKSEIAMLYNEIALVYQRMNQYLKSEEKFKISIDLYTELSKNHSEAFEPYLADTYLNMGSLLDESGKYEKSEIFYSKALELFTKLVSIYNSELYIPIIARLYQNLAFVQKKQKYYFKAVINYSKAMLIRKELVSKFPNEYNEELAQSLNSLGLLYHDLCNYKKANAYYLEAIDVRNKILKSDINNIENKADLAFIFGNLAQSYDQIKEKEKENIYYTEAINILKDITKSDSSEYCNSFLALYLHNLSWSEHDNNLEKSIIDDLQAIVIYKNLTILNPQFNSKLSICYSHLSHYYLLYKNFAESELYARKSLLIDKSLKISTINLAHSLLYQGKYDEAADLYKELGKEKYIKKQILLDFNEFKKADIVHPDIVQVRRLLK